MELEGAGEAFFPADFAQTAEAVEMVLGHGMTAHGEAAGNVSVGGRAAVGADVGPDPVQNLLLASQGVPLAGCERIGGADGHVAVSVGKRLMTVEPGKRSSKLATMAEGSQLGETTQSSMVVMVLMGADGGGW
jgi:hypothetical protein